MSIDADENLTRATDAEGDQPTRPLPLRGRSQTTTQEASAPEGRPLSAGDVSPTPGGRPPDDPRQRALRMAHEAGERVRAWFAANTFVPQWAPPRLRGPVVGYLVAILLQVVAVALVLLLARLFGSFAFQGVPSLLAIALIALTWGAGPAVLCTAMGALFIDYTLFEPFNTLAVNGGSQVVELVIFVVTGVVISVLASQTERERRASTTLARRLAAERARLDAIIEAAPDMISIHDATGTVAGLNRAGHAMLGDAGEYAPLTERPAALPLFTLDGIPVEGDDRPVARALAGEAVRGMEYRARLGKGAERVLEVSAAPFRDSWGAIVGAVAISRDVTDQRRIERELVERAAQIEATFDAMVDGVVVYDAAGVITRMNVAARAIFEQAAPQGFSRRPIGERTRALQVFDDQGNPLPPEQWPGERILRGETLAGAAVSDVRFATAGEGERWLNVSGGPVRDPDGNVIGGIAIYHDVTERRSLERRIYDSVLALLNVATTLVETPDEANAVGERIVARRLLDLTQRVLGCERVGLSVRDPRTDVMHALAVAGLPPEQERQWWAEQEAIERQGIRFSDNPDQETVARLRAGEVMTFDMRRPPYDAMPNPYGIKTLLAAPMCIGDELVGIITYDYGGAEHVYTSAELALAGAVARLAALTVERERLLREREAARASALALQHANRRMDEFLGIASHELKTPLTTVKANVQLSLRRLAALDPNASDPSAEVRRAAPAKGLLERTERQVDRLDRLVSDLLDVSRIHAGKLELRPEPADLAAIVRDAAMEQQQAWPRRTITLALPGGPAPIAADPDRVGQVVTNYLTNALKYSAEDAPVAVSLTREGDEWRVAVRDRGPGIPEAELPNVWERFHRVEGIEVRSGSGVGLGLGLHISRNIVERQGGRVGVESAPGEGSTFWFTLPIASEE